MKFTITVNRRGVLTLPAKLRKELGLHGDDLLLAETTPGGVVLRPAVTLPVEVYTEEQIAEFQESERELSDWYAAEEP
jgi:AbrB family looped-hinge helix DNA binding protein